jgi:LacI family transcriptional regulator
VSLDKSQNYGRGVLQGIADFAETTGRWSLVIDTRARGTYATDWLENWRGDGILAYVGCRATAQRLRASGIPVVELFGHHLDLSLPQVGNDDTAIGRLAAEHLLARNFRHFGFCGYREEPWSARRQAGFEAALGTAGFVPHRFSSPHSDASLSRGHCGHERLRRWLEGLPRPVAIMACNDRLALRVLDICRQLRVIVPEEVAVIGVDNDEDICRLSDPPLSSVQDNARKIGFEAALLLDRLMAHPRRPPPPPRLIPPRGLVPRRSTDVMALDDRLVVSVMRAIRERACVGLRVRDLLARFNVSRSTLYRRFESAFGRAPHEEILRVQLERAKSLLEEHDLTLEQIAELAGFRHSEYFSVAFKRRLGVTPGEYRRRARH